MLKIELTRYPLAMNVIDDLLVFMVFHDIETVDELIELNDDQIQDMEGFQPHLLEAVHVIRATRLN